MNNILSLKFNNLSILQKINIYIHPILIFLTIFYKNNFKTIKLYIKYLINDVIPMIKAFLPHLIPFIKAFIRYYVKKYYNILIIKKPELSYLWEEAEELYLQRRKIYFSLSKPEPRLNFLQYIVVFYLSIVGFMVYNYLITRTAFVYGPMGALFPYVDFDATFLQMCKAVEEALAR